jgi:hypothetical protein
VKGLPKWIIYLVKYNTCLSAFSIKCSATTYLFANHFHPSLHRNIIWDHACTDHINVWQKSSCCCPMEVYTIRKRIKVLNEWWGCNLIVCQISPPIPVNRFIVYRIQCLVAKLLRAISSRTDPIFPAKNIQIPNLSNHWRFFIGFPNWHSTNISYSVNINRANFSRVDNVNKIARKNWSKTSYVYISNLLKPS